jgi:ABC-2 type transport system ATP-binding protein
MILGLVSPTAGTATIGGVRCADAHPACTARNHLEIYAAMAGLPPERVDAVLEQAGLTAHADRRTGGFSTGMRQRLGLATALLGDPGVLLLDEPSNGLDPQGMAWLRKLLAGLAAEGRTVLISSHVLSELEQIADEVVVIHQGRLVATGSVEELTASTGSLEQTFLALTSQGAEQ